ncbi:MAG: DNA translocase FtsK 4TM domain-containing protein [Lachnospiraceae bacterium]|nr:DNA translocase FtsK 4TM domain-containing protein [Lachnospiraceae bacterium]
MATRSGTKKKTNTAKRSSGTRKNTAGRTVRRDTKRTAAKKKSFVRSEAAAVCMIAAGFILLLVNFGLLGKLGGWILGVEKGLFGQASFLLAFAVIGAAAVSYYEKGNYLRPHKIVSIFAALILISAVLHLMFGADAVSGSGSGRISASELYRMCSGGHPGGGLIGGSIANFLKGIIGYAGAYLVLIALLVICVVVITEKSFVNAARIGAARTAGVMRAGAGKTLEAAKTGRERYQQHHRENMIRRDAAREAEKLRMLEESFEDIGDGRHLSAVTLNQRGNTAAADMYANYGRDIIGGEQPGLESLEGISEPFRKAKYEPREVKNDMNFDTQVIRDVFRTEEKKPSAAVRVKQIDYESDEVPFDDDEDEVYKSYAHMLEKGTMNIETARLAGYAVGRSETEFRPQAAEPEKQEPQYFDAFRKPPVQEINEDFVNEGFSSEGLVVEGGELEEVLAAEGVQDSRMQGTGRWAQEEMPAQETGSSGEYPKEAEETGFIDAPAEDDPDDYETTYVTGSGKEMPMPDKYEADLIMRKKREERSGTGEVEKPAENVKPSAPEALSGERTKTDVPAKTAAPAAGPEKPAAGPAAQPETQAKPKPKPKPKPYVFPPNRLLERSQNSSKGSREEVMNNARKLEQVLRDFGVGVTVTAVTRGPRVSRYEMTPDTGVKVSRITSLEGDIKLALAAREIRIEAPIPGKSAVGIEVPNEESMTVKFRDILESEEFKNAKSKLSWGIGLDIQGKPVVGNIAKMPHLLVAGTTGSGKSVGINSLIMSILYRATPEEVRMILIDPKVVELSVYNGIPHLLTDVVTKPERAVSALNWAVAEMNNRYKLFQVSGTRNIGGYNEKVDEVNAKLPPDSEERMTRLPFILIIIDELAELMMHSKKDIEGSIVSLTQLARAAGIHLVVATQRPSVDVITGLIKSNIPSRIAYRLPSQMDSRTILDTGGAETLLGNGDMLYKPGDKNNPERIQGAFLSDNEVETVVEFLRKNNQSGNDEEVETAIARQMTLDLGSSGAADNGGSQKPDTDEYYADAGRLIITSGKASIGALQRKFKIGFNRAARIMDQLHEAGVVSDGEGTKERQILMTLDEFENTISG